jgi:lipoprotein NlpD
VSSPFRIILLCVSAAVLAAGCVANRPAPVVERTVPGRQAAPVAASPIPPSGSRPAPPRSAEARPDAYTVKPGDTLYSIALEHGLDYRELAFWNGLDNPGALKVGMNLRLSPPTATAGAPGATVTAPLRMPGGSVEARPLGSGPGPAPGSGPSAAPAAALPPAAATASGTVLTEPRGVRVPYSEQALAQVAKPEPAPPPRAEPARAETPKPEPAGDTARGPEDIDWAWPVKGKVIGTFNDASSKGIAIAGKAGQPVLASAPGRVIFSGTGIRGFGKLIVIKHNNTYLSVYAHNSELSVKEGQSVAKGQKIAEMGNTDAEQVKLHFEIRRFGKPVDPMKLLPAG